MLSWLVLGGVILAAALARYAYVEGVARSAAAGPRLLAAALEAARVQDLGRQVRYWQERCERLIDHALVKHDGTTGPIMQNPRQDDPFRSLMHGPFAGLGKHTIRSTVAGESVSEQRPD